MRSWCRSGTLDFPYVLRVVWGLIGRITQRAKYANKIIRFVNNAMTDNKSYVTCMSKKHV